MTRSSTPLFRPDTPPSIGRNLLVLTRNIRILIYVVFFMLIALYFARPSSSACSNYVVVIDAGSTGSRVHIYQFCNPQPSSSSHASPRLHHETFEQLKPGLSSFSSPSLAASSLKPLLDIAVDTIPRAFQKCTPVVVKATAGLRLLPGSQANDILHAVEKMLLDSYPFRVVGVDVMDGEDEAVFAWTTVNYLLDQNKEPNVSLNGGGGDVETVGVADLGGASTQIVFEAQHDCKDTVSRDKKEKCSYYAMKKMSGRHVPLYQHSYLGYGLMEARKRVLALRSGDHQAKTNMPFPCFTHPDHAHKLDSGVLVEYDKNGSFEQCKTLVKQLFDTTQKCTFAHCSFNAVHQPPFPSSSTLYLFSYFFDRTRLILLPEDESEVFRWSLDDFRKYAKQTCSKPFKDDAFICFDSVYMVSLLESYGVTNDNDLIIRKKINRVEVGWCLGLAVDLASAPTCPE